MWVAPGARMQSVRVTVASVLFAMVGACNRNVIASFETEAGAEPRAVPLLVVAPSALDSEVRRDAGARGDGVIQLAASEGAPFGIAVDATRVYFTTRDAVKSVPKAGGVATVVASQ